MYQFHGWATILDDPYESDPIVLRSAFEKIDRRLAELGDRLQVSGIKFVNGYPLLWLAGFRNHRDPTPIELFDFVARSASASYGLLYIRDDEDPSVSSNKFRVWRLARGRLESMTDPFLSPCAPAIEDP